MMIVAVDTPSWGAWAVPAGVVIAALVTTLFAPLVTRSRSKPPCEILKTYVEIYKDLPDGDAKDHLLASIEGRLYQLTATPEPGNRIIQTPPPGVSLIQRELSAGLPKLLLFALGVLGAIAAGLLSMRYNDTDTAKWWIFYIVADIPFFVAIGSAMSRNVYREREATNYAHEILNDIAEKKRQGVSSYTETDGHQPESAISTDSSPVD